MVESGKNEKLQIFMLLQRTLIFSGSGADVMILEIF
jgi:hypothetical protein